MAKVTIQLDGMQALQRAITRAPDVVKAHAGDAVASTSFAVAQRAKALAPVATGTLKGAITAQASKGLTGGVTIGPQAFYWRFVEYGTQRTSARPFLRTAAEMESNAFIQRMRAIGPKLEKDFSGGRFL